MTKKQVENINEICKIYYDFQEDMTNKNNKFSGETIVFIDESKWIWEFVQATLRSQSFNFIKLPSNTPIRQSWNRFKHAPRIIIHWESHLRSGGAIVEEILDIDKGYNIAERVIVVSTNPTREDVVYFSELNIRRIIHLRNIDKFLAQAKISLENHLITPPEKNKTESAWRLILKKIDLVSSRTPIEDMEKFEVDVLNFMQDQEESARTFDVLASFASFKGQNTEAYQLWEKSLQKNGSYYRAYNNLIDFLRKTNRHQEAFALMKKMQELNRSSISRLVKMGETQATLGDDDSAEHYFKSALSRDAWCSEALNGMAQIRFRQGHLEETREYLAKSSLAEKAASELNASGIELVQAKKYSQALEHYTKAQYVLPQQEKGPMLFYNIGLCYHRWGKNDMAIEFLNIALIKEPNYTKAQKLLESISAKISV